MADFATRDDTMKETTSPPTDDEERRFNPAEAIDIQPPPGASFDSPVLRSLELVSEVLGELEGNHQFLTEKAEIQYIHYFREKQVILVIDVQKSVDAYLSGNNHLFFVVRTKSTSNHNIETEPICIAYAPSQPPRPVGDYIVSMVLDLYNEMASFPGSQIEDGMFQALLLAGEYKLLTNSDGKYASNILRALFRGPARFSTEDEKFIEIILDIEDKAPSALFEIICRISKRESQFLSMRHALFPDRYRRNFTRPLIDYLHHVDSLVYIINHLRNPCEPCTMTHCPTCLHHLVECGAILNRLQDRLENGNLIKSSDDDPYSIWHSPDFARIEEAIRIAVDRLGIDPPRRFW